jgi:hypothetical protein
MQRAKSNALLWIAAAVASAAPAAVLAAPLDEGSCALARVEQGQLDATGVRDDVGRGADWGKANLPPERLRLVARWIELEEQILFRCPRPKPPPESEATAALGTDEKAAATGAAPDEAAEPKKPKKKREGQDGIAKEKKKKQVKAAGEEPKPAVKKKPKVNDAYSPSVEPGSTGEVQHATPEPPAVDDSYKPPPLSP